MIYLVNCMKCHTQGEAVFDFILYLDVEAYEMLFSDQCKSRKHCVPHLEICIYGLSLLLGDFKLHDFS